MNFNWRTSDAGVTRRTSTHSQIGVVACNAWGDVTPGKC